MTTVHYPPTLSRNDSNPNLWTIRQVTNRSDGPGLTTTLTGSLTGSLPQLRDAAAAEAAAYEDKADQFGVAAWQSLVAEIDAQMENPAR